MSKQEHREKKLLLVAICLLIVVLFGQRVTTQWPFLAKRAFNSLWIDARTIRNGCSKGSKPQKLSLRHYPFMHVLPIFLPILSTCLSFPLVPPHFSPSPCVDIQATPGRTCSNKRRLCREGGGYRIYSFEMSRAGVCKVLIWSLPWAETRGWRTRRSAHSEGYRTHCLLSLGNCQEWGCW